MLNGVWLGVFWGGHLLSEKLCIRKIWMHQLLKTSFCSLFSNFCRAESHRANFKHNHIKWQVLKNVLILFRKIWSGGSNYFDVSISKKKKFFLVPKKPQVSCQNGLILPLDMKLGVIFFNSKVMGRKQQHIHFLEKYRFFFAVKIILSEKRFFWEEGG